MQVSRALDLLQERLAESAQGHTIAALMDALVNVYVPCCASILGGQTSPKGDFEKVEKNKKSRKWLFFWPFLDLFKTAQARTRIAGVQHTAAAAAVQLQWGGHRRHGAPPPPKQGL